MTATHIDTDWLLEATRREWESALDYVACWDELDLVEQDDVICEWPMVQAYVYVLRERASAGSLSCEQLARWAELSSFMEGHRPTLEQVLGAGNV